MTPDLALQEALTRAFKGAGTAAGSNVYDKVPARAAYPRIVFGPRQIVPFGAACLGMTEVSQQVDAWSTALGRGEISRLAGDIVAVILSGALAPKNHRLVLIEVETTEITPQPDGETSRARIAIRAVLQPAD